MRPVSVATRGMSIFMESNPAKNDPNEVDSGRIEVAWFESENIIWIKPIIIRAD